jgi:hypothetical protein
MCIGLAFTQGRIRGALNAKELVKKWIHFVTPNPTGNGYRRSGFLMPTEWLTLSANFAYTGAENT